MIQIIINGETTPIGKPLPEKIEALTVVNIVNHLQPPIIVPAEQAILIDKWLKEMIGKCVCEYAMYNGTFVTLEEIRETIK
jgi:hypothetical protein